ncbi:glycosyl transferase [Flavonifractor plautii]|nr:glycosyl transferase [Flavonifractor plautii]
MGHDFSSLMAMVIDVTVAMEEKVLRELGEFRPDCVVADSICVWGKLYARRLGLPLVCSTTTFAFDQETAGAMRPGPLEVFYTLTGLPQIGKRLALLREHGYEVKKLTELIQNDSETDTIVYTSRAFQPGGEHFGERVAFVGPSLPELPPRTQRRKRPLVYVSLGTVMHGNTGFTGPARRAWGRAVGCAAVGGQPGGGGSAGRPAPNVRAEARVEQLRVLGRHRCFSPTVG